MAAARNDGKAVSNGNIFLPTYYLFNKILSHFYENSNLIE